MTDPTAEFFSELSRRGHEPLLEKASGTVRFELLDGERTDRWLVSVQKGDLTVSHNGGAADCVLRADRALFDRLAGGELNAMAAMLRGELAVGGDYKLLVRLQRLFPGPPEAREKGRGAGYARRHA